MAAWCGPPGRMGLVWRNLLEEMLSAPPPSLPKMPKGFMWGAAATAIECGERPAALPWLPVTEFMPKPPGWKKEFCAREWKSGKWDVISAVFAAELEMGLGGVLNMPLRKGVSGW